LAGLALISLVLQEETLRSLYECGVKKEHPVCQTYRAVKELKIQAERVKNRDSVLYMAGT